MNSTISLQLPEGHIKQIKEYYRNRLDELQRESNEITALLAEIKKNEADKTTIVNSQNGVAPTLVSITGVYSKGYNTKWSNIKKAQFVLKSEGKALPTGEIVDIIITKHEPALKKDRKRFVGSMSSILSGNSKEGGTFIREKNDLDDWIYNIH